MNRPKMQRKTTHALPPVCGSMGMERWEMPAGVIQWERTSSCTPQYAGASVRGPPAWGLGEVLTTPPRAKTLLRDIQQTQYTTEICTDHS